MSACIWNENDKLTNFTCEWQLICVWSSSFIIAVKPANVKAMSNCGFIYLDTKTLDSQPFCIPTPRQKSMLEVTPFKDNTLGWRYAQVNGQCETIHFLQDLWHAC